MQTESCKPSGERQDAAVILVTQMGGLGDVVLTSQLITSLRRGMPNSDVSLVCRRATAVVAELFPVKPSRVIGLDYDPSAWPADDHGAAAMAAVRDRFADSHAAL